jgi:hypothetical protein
MNLRKFLTTKKRRHYGKSKYFTDSHSNKIKNNKFKSFNEGRLVRNDE